MSGSGNGGDRQSALVARARSLSDPRLADRVEGWIRQDFQDQRRIEAEQQRAEAEQSDRALSDLSLRIMRGEANLPDIETAYDGGRGWLSPSDRTRLTGTVEKRNADLAEKAVEQARVSAALAGFGTLDPRSDRDRKAVDDHFTMLAASWRDLPAQEQTDRMMQAVQRYGMVPDPLRSTIRGALRRSDQPQMVADAAGLVERIRNANPDLLRDFGQEDIARANLVGTYTGVGMPAPEAVRLATEATKVPEAERATRKEAYEAMKTDQPTASADYVRSQLVGGWLSRHFPGSGVPNAAPPAELVAEFDKVAAAEFSRHGNLDAARKTAADAVRRVWGLSTVGGLTPDGAGASGGFRLMRNAPELFYSRAGLPGDQGEWMREQLVAGMKARGGLWDESAGNLADRFMLQVAPSHTDPTTGNPLYQVWVKDRNGALSVLREADEQPVLWRPDWNSSPAADRQRAAIEAHRTGRAFVKAGGLNTEINQALVDATASSMGAY